MTDWQTCQHCMETKPINDYYKVGGQAKNKDRRVLTCKTCYLEKKNRSFALKPENYIRRSFSQLRHSRKKSSPNMAWDITCEDVIEIYFKQNGECALTGIRLDHTRTGDRRKRNPFNISIDRIDNDVGYVVSNIQLVCSVVNMMKGGWNESDFLYVCKRVAMYGKD